MNAEKGAVIQEGAGKRNAKDARAADSLLLFKLARTVELNGSRQGQGNGGDSSSAAGLATTCDKGEKKDDGVTGNQLTMLFKKGADGRAERIFQRQCRR